MSNRTVEGRVLSQSQQIQVLSTPPSPTGSGLLPACVTAARAGSKWFAMNHETQLRFSVAVPHSPRNLRTHFKPTPSPITIDRPPPSSHQVLSTDQLSLAVKLARRDLCRGLLQHPPLLHSDRQGPVSATCPSHPPLSSKPPLSTQHLPNTYHGTDDRRTDVQPRLVPQGAVNVPSSLRTDHTVNGRAVIAQHTVDKKTAGVSLSVGVQHTVGGGDSGVPPRLGGQHSVKRRIENLPAGTVWPRKMSEGHGMRWRQGDSERVLWGEREGEEERERRRTDELAARNSRMVYSLQRQVEALERETQRLSVRDTKKSRAVHRLAAARRAAIRTLRLLLASSHPLPSLPSELPLLVQRLSLLSAQLRDTPTGELGASAAWGKGALTACEDQLEELMEQLSQQALAGSKHLPPSPHTASKGRAVKEGNVLGQTSPSARRSRRRRQKRDVVLRHHKRARPAHVHALRGHTHFSQPTYSSLCKRQKPLAQKQFTSFHENSQQPPPFTPPHPRPPPSTPSPHRAVQDSHPHPPPSTPSPVETQKGSQNLPPPITGHPPPPANHRGSCKLDGKLTMPSKECSEMPAQHLQSRPYPSLEAGVWQEVECCHPETEAFLQPRLAVTEADSDQVLDHLLGDVLEECQRLEDDAHMEQAAQALVQAPDVQVLLERVAQMEMEEDRCRQKWTTINYHVQPPQVPASTGAVEVPSYSLPPTFLSILHDQQRHQLTRVSLKGVDSWSFVEGLAEEVLDGIVESVSEEVNDACNGYVEGLYSEEFLSSTHKHYTTV